MRLVEVFAAAKVNIGWRVGERRQDGYHEVSGLVQTISLTDRLRVETGSDDAGLRVVVPRHPELESVSNLVVAAARALGDRGPVTITIDKSIPVAAGLGGGSADAAAALVGLNAVWGCGRTARQLVELAAGIGSDVPAILVGGLVHASGRGEVVRAVGGASDGAFVLGIGGEHVSAAEAYAKLDDLGALPAGAFHHNDLERAACALVPSLQARLGAMREAAGIAFVSGSGPTVVGACADEAHARGVAARVRDHFTDVVVARPTTWGVRLLLGRGGNP